MNFIKDDKDKKNSRDIYSGTEEEPENEDGDYYVFSEEYDDELKLYSDKREERRRRKKIRKKRIAFISVLVVMAAIVCLNWDALSPSAISETVQEFISNFGSSKYPIEFDEGTMKAAVPVGSNIGILTDTTFLIYSQNGSKLAVRSHGINNPAAVSGGNKALIYDRGGKQFRVETRMHEAYEATAAYDITTAAMGTSGNFAVVTEADDYLSELIVYNNLYNNVFKWDTSQGRVLAAALSPDGKKIAAVVIGARNGSIFSDVYIFNLNSKTPVAVKKYDGILLYSIRFKDNKRIAAVGDSEAVFLDTSGKERSVYSYGDKELECSSNGDGPTVLVFNNGLSSSNVVSLGSDGKVIGTTDIEASGVTIVSNSDGKSIIVANGKIFAINDDCTKKSKIAVSGEMLSAITMKNRVFVFGTQSVGRYDLK